MALARYESVAVNTAGDVIPNATVEVRRDQPGRPVVPLWADREGTVALGNPITADSEGKFGFHVTGGSYYIRVFTGPSQQPLQQYVRRYQAIGTAGERDVEDLASALEAGTATYPTLPELQAFVPLEAGVGGKVTTGEDAGFYHYDFIGEAWVFDRPLFDTLARMNITGGDANDIEAEIASGVADSAVVMLWIEAAATNTGPVTINAKPLKTIDGNDLLAGQWLAGRTYWFSDEGTFYKLRTESDVSGLVAQAEAAATAAQEAQGASETARTGAETARDEAQGYAAGLNIAPIAPGDAGKVLQVNVTEDGSDWVDLPDPDGDKGDITVSGNGAVFDLNAGSVDTTALADTSVTESKLSDALALSLASVQTSRATLADVDATRYNVAYLAEIGRAGLFQWDSSNLSARVAADPDQGVYVPPASDATGASGAWVRAVDGGLSLDWFGFGSANAGLTNTLIFNRVIALANTLKRAIVIPPGIFDIAISGSGSAANNGIKLLSDTHIRGHGPRRSILNLTGSAGNTNLNNFSAGSGIGRVYTPGVANNGISNCLLEDFAVTMNHPGTSIDPSTAIQIGIDFRHISRSTIRRCYVGNFSPSLGTKGIAQEYLVQGYGIALGGSSGAAVDYAHQELNLIEDSTIVGALHCISMEFVGPYTGAAYQTTIRRNDLQMAHTLIMQGGTGGGGNVIEGNTLQNLVHPNGNVNPTMGIRINGHGNRIEMDYGEFGADCQHMISLATSSARNWVSISGINGASGGIVNGVQDQGTNNVIEYFANTNGSGGWDSFGAPTRRVNKVDTVMA